MGCMGAEPRCGVHWLCVTQGHIKVCVLHKGIANTKKIQYLYIYFWLCNYKSFIYECREGSRRYIISNFFNVSLYLDVWNSRTYLIVSFIVYKYSYINTSLFCFCCNYFSFLFINDFLTVDAICCVLVYSVS